MKNATPKQISLVSAILLGLIICATLVPVKLLVPDFLHWGLVLAIPLLVFISGYVILHYTLKNYIYRRIKPIYKVINETKAPAGNNTSKINVDKNTIDNLEDDVNKWREKKSKSIKKSQKLDQFRKEFLGNVFHELKTPIFNIQGYLESVIDGGIKDDTINLKFLQKANKNVRRIAQIVDDLQMISNLSDGSFPVAEEKFNITNLVTESIDTLEIHAQKDNINIEIKEGCEKSFIVYADVELIQQVLSNLITNSIKYGSENGKTQIGIYDMNENILVEVTDNGIGIKSEHLPRIFERFYRVDKNRSREQGGTGLGLSIVKHIVESHNQTINVRSTPGIGTTFGFTLKKA
jgi:two-component system phosphate regulon sensor histidine kinase PhoR